MAEINLPAADTVVKTVRTYAVDLTERVIWTFLGAAGAVALAAGPTDMLNVSFWQGAVTAGMAAVVTLVKGIAARLIGPKNSASTAPSV
ncbi:holin [Streptomyces phage OnionKnight]|nr:holin [Streptomyces phage OnionKnight]